MCAEKMGSGLFGYGGAWWKYYVSRCAELNVIARVARVSVQQLVDSLLAGVVGQLSRLHKAIFTVYYVQPERSRD